MTEKIQVGDVTVDVTFKPIKNIHISVHPPTGRVSISAPRRVSLDTLRVYVIGRMAWIKKHQAKMQSQERETPREYIDRESHYLWGRRYLLQVIEANQPPAVEIKHHQIVLSVRPKSSAQKREAVMSAWYREETKKAALPYIEKWQAIMGVKAEKLHIQHMKTRWGSCNPRTRGIRLNSELAKKPRECLEYVVVHELIHLLEPTHNARFYALMDRYLPNWKHIRKQLNQTPLSHEEWEY
jgi:predicted metal-dependent hydrolase